MATTQAQRASLFNTLAEMMGQQDAETLVEQLPPTGWDTMATKDDVRVLGATITAALTEGLAQAAKERAELQATMATGLAEGLAEAAKERAEIVKTMADGFAEAAKERAEIIKTMADAAKERAEIVKSQARSLYVTVSTVVLAAVSIWIALLVGPGAS
ncbi:MAG: hypothetical protein F4Z00_16835 [Acidimicrobiaceae bacterium]|nr:hypothetical protein [Acidimicrobiaceae bacterium]MXZ67194.1 hypothetical protein [Acidimicrobiaceae bacterium]MYF32290.1 hypothetical protein [Acidimicrobiaceae bacterium]MYG78242.1 hypothetical protein [Acidimicrobiaceae bacterium]MYJ30255.1 hypothetical protein [Acidimicrobiaceae bacterium]